MAATDTDNAGVPYESPSNKDAKIDGLCLADGTAVVLTFEQANALNGGGIVTALNFMGAWKVWGNYTGCYPSSTDPKDMFIPCGRMFAYVQNTIIRTCWQFLDKPMNRRLLDTITDTVNIWLNGLVGSGYLLGCPCGDQRGREPRDPADGGHHQDSCLHDPGQPGAGDRLCAGV